MRETITQKRDALRTLVQSGLPLKQADAVAQLVYDLNAESIDAVRDELRVWNARMGLWLILLGFALVTGLIAAIPLVFL
ncbi:hypothetical protein [Methylobacterium radiodurans]|uniref:Uncharacterized protein n=1 Tax=Methylobacterium radiodurans TaxID=2202828 RepID=A0A2U8VMY8_9HYPH|nr:hypothetical protein [Methylobacterium radiodurans]AWN35049.1 hypothetical protein DK427_04240 [Methylobacterium radiodurans]